MTASGNESTSTRSGSLSLAAGSKTATVTVSQEAKLGTATFSASIANYQAPPSTSVISVTVDLSVAAPAGGVGTTVKFFLRGWRTSNLTGGSVRVTDDITTSYIEVDEGSKTATVYVSAALLYSDVNRGGDKPPFMSGVSWGETYYPMPQKYILGN